MKLLCIFFFLGVTLLEVCDGKSVSAQDNVLLVKKNFESCTFDFSDTTYFSHLSPKESGRSVGSGSGCGIRLDPEKSGRFTSMSSVWVSIFPLNQLEQATASQGLYKDDAGNWKFMGNPMGIYFVSFKRISLEQQKNGNDTILIGRQIENAKDQNGHLMTFEGIHILRITPKYLVTMDFSFEFQLPKATMDALVNDMVKLMESVHVTTNPFPTAR